MQFLSGLSLLGLMTFIAFSSVSRADGQDEVISNPEYVERPVDSRLRIENNSGDVYVSQVVIENSGDLDMEDIDTDFRGRGGDEMNDGWSRRDNRDNYRRRGDRSRDNWYPNPGYQNVGVCRIFSLRTRNIYTGQPMYDVGIQYGWNFVPMYRGSYWEVLNQYRWMVQARQCYPG